MGTKKKSQQADSDLSAEMPTARADVLFDTELDVELGRGWFKTRIINHPWAVELLTKTITLGTLPAGFGMLVHFLGAPYWVALTAAGIGLATALVLIYAGKTRTPHPNRHRNHRKR